MIRKSKNNEDKPDFEKMWGEVKEDIQEQDAEQDIIASTPSPSAPPRSRVICSDSHGAATSPPPKSTSPPS